ncbi:MAG: Crp/Fnr family transcriptional regulator [Lentimicrobiaceae bacterium]|nr:Crp/Fnr family transcriptional regulator [Lentimicrobiaceae bacterium]
MSKAAETLTTENLGYLSCNKAMVRFKRGDSIIKQGMFSTNVAYLRKGLAKIHLSGPYTEQIVRLVKAPSYLGLPTSIGDKINQYSVTAISEAEVCYIDMASFRYLLKDNELFSYQIVLELCSNELEAIRRCANRTQKQVRGNIADVILEFADKIYASDTFTLPISQAEIGNLVDTSRESISRTLSEFHKDGIIRFTGKKIEILNKKSLMLISQTG